MLDMGLGFSSEKGLRDTLGSLGLRAVVAAAPPQHPSKVAFAPQVEEAGPPRQQQWPVLPPAPSVVVPPPSTAYPPTQVRAAVRDHRAAGAVLLGTVLARCKTGDLLFLSGASWRDAVHRWCTWRTYSHVAMIDMSGGQEAPMLWESVPEPDGCLDVITNALAPGGPRVVDALQRVARHAETFGAKNNFCVIAVLSLRLPHADPDSVLASMMANHLSQFQERVHPSGEQARRLASVRASLQEDAAPPRPSSAELVAETYKAMALLERQCDAASLGPDDFAWRRDRLPFVEGFGLSDEIHVYKVYCALDPFFVVDRANSSV